MLDKINFLKVITYPVLSVTTHLLGTFQGIAAVSVTFQHQICILAKELCYLEEKTPRNALKIRPIHIDPERNQPASHKVNSVQEAFAKCLAVHILVVSVCEI